MIQWCSVFRKSFRFCLFYACWYHSYGKTNKLTKLTFENWNFKVKMMHINVLFCTLGLKQWPFYQLTERDYGDALANLWISLVYVHHYVAVWGLFIVITVSRWVLRSIWAIVPLIYSAILGLVIQRDHDVVRYLLVELIKVNSSFKVKTLHLRLNKILDFFYLNWWLIIIYKYVS